MPVSSADKVAFKVIDTWLDYKIRYSNIPGFQVSIRKKGELVFSQAYGYANLAKKEKYTSAHIGRIASQSKMFTSALTFVLQDLGKLNINDKVIDYLPEFRKHKDKRFKDITIRDLLTNRSGIFRDGIDSSFWDLEKDFLSKGSLINEIMQENLVYDPNTVTKYSNIGFSLLGLVLEVAGEDGYSNLIDKYILSKLSDVKFYSDYTSSKEIKYASGHSKPFYEKNRKNIKHSSAKAYSPAAGFCGNADGTTQFLHDLYFTNKIVSEHVRKELLYLNWPVKNIKNEFYGLGILSSTINDDIYIGHSGGYPGFSSQTRHCLYSDYIFGFIMNTNELFGFNIIRSMNEIIQKIGKEFTQLELKDVVVSAPIMNKWGGSLYVVGKNKAISFVLDNWLLTQETTELQKGNDGLYYADKLSGYVSVGEPFKFSFQGKKIKTVKFGSFTYYEESDFIKRSKENLS